MTTRLGVPNVIEQSRTMMTTVVAEMAQQRTKTFEQFMHAIRKSRLSDYVGPEQEAALREIYNKNRRLKKRTTPFGLATMRTVRQ